MWSSILGKHVSLSSGKCCTSWCTFLQQRPVVGSEWLADFQRELRCRPTCQRISRMRPPISIMLNTTGIFSVCFCAVAGRNMRRWHPRDSEGRRLLRHQLWDLRWQWLQSKGRRWCVLLHQSSQFFGPHLLVHCRRTVCHRGR